MNTGYLSKSEKGIVERKVAVYNPENKPVNELPTIYGFNNGGYTSFWHGVLIAEDGTALGEHLCSSELYMLHDLGILEGTREDRHETFKKHYPHGYRMEFVSYHDVKRHANLKRILEDLNSRGAKHSDAVHAPI